MFLIELAVFVLGLCIGSFLNVVIYRYNTGRGVNGRSSCMSCGKKLQWYELIPLASFFLQSGKCRGCGSRISWQYPVVEFLTGALFAGIYERFGLSWISLYLAVIWALLLVMFMYDLRHKIIPDGIVYAFILLSFILSLITAPPAAAMLSTVLSGPVVALPFFLIWFFSSGRWMGFGDAKLALGIGWFLGVSGGYAAVVLAFWIGAAIGLILIALRSGNLNMKSEIPFAPFLIAGMAIVFFKGLGFGDLVSLFNFIRI